MISNAFQSFAIATECLARRQEDLTYLELEAWALEVACRAAENRARGTGYGNDDAIDHMRGRDFRTKHA